MVQLKRQHGSRLGYKSKQRGQRCVAWPAASEARYEVQLPLAAAAAVSWLPQWGAACVVNRLTAAACSAARRVLPICGPACCPEDLPR